MDIIREMIQRPQYPAPTFTLNPEVKDFYDFTTADIEITDYQKPADHRHTHCDMISRYDTSERMNAIVTVDEDREQARQ